MRYRNSAACGLVAAALLAGCATGPQYAMPDRAPVTATQPLDLPAWPDATLIRCPRGEYDPQAICPWGSEWIGYDSTAADALEEYAIAAQANTDIAAANADQIDALDTEADRRNDTAASLDDSLAAERRGRWFERLGWLGGVALIIAVAL